MRQLGMDWFELLFQIVVFGTFVETGTALLHALNERLSGWMEDSGGNLPRGVRPLIALAVLSVAIFAASRIGIIDLIARGYHALTLVFIAVLVLPLLTVGVYRIYRRSATPAE